VLRVILSMKVWSSKICLNLPGDPIRI
jgi:hypothetical protein